MTEQDQPKMSEQDLQEWVGHTESCEDNLTVNLVQKLAVTLDNTPPDAGDVLPRLWHWALFAIPRPTQELGPDGYPEFGGFLPPAEGRSRMWVGGRIDFIHPLLVGKPAERKSTLQEITHKKGQSGDLMFVTVHHEYVQDFVACIREERDIVYRMPGPFQSRSSWQTPPEAAWSCEVEPSSTMLFRYSAVGFNAHRIHYDQEYATQVEGYDGLVVHGSLATLLMYREFMKNNPGTVPVSLTYRSLRPLISPKPFIVAGHLVSKEVASGDAEAGGEDNSRTGTAKLWVEQDGTMAHEAELQFRYV